MQTFFLYVGLSGLAITLTTIFAIWLCHNGSHPVLEAVSRIRHLPRIAQFFLIAFVLFQYVHHERGGSDHTGLAVFQGAVDIILAYDI